MPFDDLIDRLLEREEGRLEAFEDILRRRLRSALDEAEADFAAFAERLLRFEASIAENHGVAGSRVSARLEEAIAEAFGAQGGGAVAGALGAAVTAAGIRAARHGDSRQAVRAGAEAAGRVIASQITRAAREGGLRRSAGQFSLDLLGELQRGQRNG